MYIELKLTIEKGELTDESFHQIISLLEEPCGFYVDDVGARLSNKFDSVEKCAAAIELLLREVAEPKERTFIIVLLCWGKGVAPNTPDNIEAEHSAVIYYDIGKKGFLFFLYESSRGKRESPQTQRHSLSLSKKNGSYYIYTIVTPKKTRQKWKGDVARSK